MEKNVLENEIRRGELIAPIMLACSIFCLTILGIISEPCAYAEEQVVSTTSLSFPNTQPHKNFVVNKIINKQGKVEIVSPSKEIKTYDDILSMSRIEGRYLESICGKISDNLCSKYNQMEENDQIDVLVHLKIPLVKHLDKTKHSVAELKEQSLTISKLAPFTSIEEISKKYGIKYEEKLSNTSFRTKLKKADISRLMFDDSIAAIEEHVTPFPLAIIPITADFSSLATSAFNPPLLPGDPQGSGVHAATFESGICWDTFYCLGNLVERNIDITLGCDDHSQKTFKCLWNAAPEATFYHQNATNYFSATSQAYIVNNAIETVSMSAISTEGSNSYEHLVVDDFAYRFPYPNFFNPSGNFGYDAEVLWQCYNAINVGNVVHNHEKHYQLLPDDFPGGPQTSTRNPKAIIGPCISPGKCTETWTVCASNSQCANTCTSHQWCDWTGDFCTSDDMCKPFWGSCLGKCTVTGDDCRVNSQCGTSEECIYPGHCLEAPERSCSSDADCIIAPKCLTIGLCESGDRCTTDSDCVKNKCACTGDREMPHIIAPGLHPYYVDVPQGIDCIWTDKCFTNFRGGGTSFSAPIANGIGADVISADSRMKYSPEKVRVALILTAHNVDAGHWYQDIDGRDGTGVISGNDAVLFAKNHTTVSPNSPAVENGLSNVGSLSRDNSGEEIQFKIKIPNVKPKGKHLRIVLTWDSNPDVDGGKNALSDLDLTVTAETGTFGSYRWDSNVEVVDISPEKLVAGKTYTAKVHVLSVNIPTGARAEFFYWAIGWTWVKDHAQFDPNFDGCIDRADLDILLADIRSLGPHNRSYDLNGDGKVDIADARYLVTLFTNPLGAPCKRQEGGLLEGN